MHHPHVPMRHGAVVVAAQAEVQERPILHAHAGADLRRHERVLLLLQRDWGDDVLREDTGSWESKWERLHVTVALQLAEAEGRNGCEYTAEFYYEEKDSNARFVLPVGCELTASSAQVRGAWAQCMLELPLHVPDVQLMVRISLVYPRPLCRVSAGDLVLVFIDANTAMYECAPGYFLAGGATLHAGQCVRCRGPHAEQSIAPTLAQEAQFCKAGFFLKGCPALLSARHMRDNDCTACDELLAGAEFADVLREAAEPCKWQCLDGYHETGCRIECVSVIPQTPMLLGLWISGVGGPKCPRDKGAWGHRECCLLVLSGFVLVCTQAYIGF